jgi:hypothetical protein
MSHLKDQLIKLGSDNPSLRKHIRPVLDRISRSKTALGEEAKKVIENFKRSLDERTFKKIIEEAAQEAGIDRLLSEITSYREGPVSFRYVLKNLDGTAAGRVLVSWGPEDTENTVEEGMPVVILEDGGLNEVDKERVEGMRELKRKLPRLLSRNQGIFE